MMDAPAPEESAVLPMVSIVMPCLNEADYIEACLRTVERQDYPSELIQVVIADGGSTDGTVEILREAMKIDERVLLIDNPGRIQSCGLNRAIRCSRGEIIVRMDVHCEYAEDYVRKCVEVLRRVSADNVGGAQRAKATTRFQRALCAALESPIGMGNARYRMADEEGAVDTVFLGAFRRSVFERVGLYDEGAVTNEDAELNGRIVRSGGKVYLSREIRVFYHPRKSAKALIRQYFRYGVGRARTTLKQRSLPKLRSIAPFVALGSAVTMASIPGLRWLLGPSLGLYGLVTMAEALRCGKRLGWRDVPLVWAMFPMIHGAHGVGFAVGLIRYGAVSTFGEIEYLATNDSPTREDG